jgi:Response regulator receiver domain
LAGIGSPEERTQCVWNGSIDWLSVIFGHSVRTGGMALAGALIWTGWSNPLPTKPRRRAVGQKISRSWRRFPARLSPVRFPVLLGHHQRGARARGEELMPDRRLLVSVVDDDESVRESLPDLLNEFGYSVRTFSSGLEFLASDALDQTKCLILDIVMPGMTGIELQAELKRRDKRLPIM